MFKKYLLLSLIIINNFTVHSKEILHLGFPFQNETIFPINLDITKLPTSLLFKPIATKEHGKIICHLCSSIEALSDTSFRIHFASKTSLWLDTIPITAKDFIFTLEVLKSLNKDLVVKKQLDHIHLHKILPNASYIDVDVKSENIFFDFLSTKTLLPFHLEQPIWAPLVDKSEYLKLSNYIKSPIQKGLYHGTFYPLSVNESEMTLISSSLTEGDTLHLHFLESPEKLINELKKNTLDYAFFDSTSQVPTSTLDISNYETKTFPSYYLEEIVFNFRNLILNDKNVRQAISLILTSLTSELNNGLNKNLNFEIQPSNSFYLPFANIKPVDLLVQKAPKDFFLESGWKKNIETSLLTKNKQTLKLELLVFDNATYRKIFCEKLKTKLLQEGVLLELKFMPLPAFKEALERMEFPSMALLAHELPLNTRWSSLFSSEAIPAFFNEYTGHNFSAWVNPEVDSIVKKLDLEKSEAGLEKLMRQLSEFYQKDLPAKPLFFHKKLIAFKKGKNIPLFLENSAG